MNRTLLRVAYVAAMLLAVGAVDARAPIFATPDQADLIRAARSLQDGFEKDAFEKYQRAARFGNKEAQKNIALMYIKGLGVEKDWAKAFAWLKLAATHQDPRIVMARDEVYGALREDERTAADGYFRAISSEYGDLEALLRREAWVRKQKRDVTGSRLGTIGALRVQVADSTGYNWELTGNEYFHVLETYILELKQYIGEVELGEFTFRDEDIQE